MKLLPQTESIRIRSDKSTITVYVTIPNVSMGDPILQKYSYTNYHTSVNYDVTKFVSDELIEH